MRRCLRWSFTSKNDALISWEDDGGIVRWLLLQRTSQLRRNASSRLHPRRFLSNCCAPTCYFTPAATDWRSVYTLHAPTLASCRFDKHELILIIFGRKHLHTFTNDTYVQLSLSLHFYLLYLLLNSCDGNDAFWRSSMLVKQSSSFSRKHRTLSLRICVRQTVRLTTELSLHICVR